MVNSEWQKNFERINAKQLPAPSWQSDQESLRDIFRFAERNGLNPEYALSAPISQLRTIIKEAKRAIFDEDLDRLQELFRLAATLSIVELRLVLGTTVPSEILVNKSGEGTSEEYQISLNKEQFLRFIQSLRLFFRFSIVENKRINKELTLAGINSNHITDEVIIQ